MPCHPRSAPARSYLTLVGFALLYGALMVADIYLLAKYRQVRCSRHSYNRG